MTTDVMLVKAEFTAFLKQYTVYKVLRNNNRFNLDMESIRLSILEDEEFCRFIYYKGKHMGGVIIRRNKIKHLFIYPEHNPHLMEIMKTIHENAVKDADSSKSIACLPSNSNQAVNFGKLGYKTIRKMHCMIGPLENVSWKAPMGYKFVRPSADDEEMIVELFYNANINEPWHQPVTKEFFARGASLYFDNNIIETILDASSICIEERTGNAVGACLISMDEGYPFVYDLHVLEEHRRKGIASNMMKKAISKMTKHYGFMRLFVIDGNPAKRIYDKLGFIAGNPIFIMKYTSDADI